MAWPTTELVLADLVAPFVPDETAWNDERAAVRAICAELGLDPAGAETDVAARLTAIEDAIDALPPPGSLVSGGVVGRRTTNLSQADGWQVTPLQEGPWWSAGAPTLMTVPEGAGGTYLLCWEFGWAVHSSGVRAAQLELNASPISVRGHPGMATFDAIVGGSVIQALVPGGVLRFNVYQNAVNPLNVVRAIVWAQLLGE